MEKVEELLKLRSSMDIWSTFDRANLDFYETTFRRLDGVGKSILEIGSGYGFTSIFFALRGARQVSGFEFIPEALHKSIEPSTVVECLFSIHHSLLEWLCNGRPKRDLMGI